jgi:energy-coupling factor transporter transmembrane protein EcfT
MPIFSSSNSFRGQLPGETVILITRRHWIVLFWPLFFVFLFSVLPFTVYYFVRSEIWYSLYANLYWFISAVLWLMLWNVFFFQLMLYFLNTLVITNLRVIENQQKGFFNYTANEFKRDKVQDATVKTQGLLANLLGYGDVEVQTAGTQNKFYFSYYPNPEKIKEIIISP